ncbi:hypothetical protein ACJRO7_015427 [Eucalyptus globulus]|uniref:TIR domain-containing protein n=1 Tax=Eucalyptus globulus TaxID=34317 RepID=A0ABD3L3J3_EUCGL
MGFNGSQALMIILAMTVGGLFSRQLMKRKRRTDSESTDDLVLGEEYDVFLSFRGRDTRLNFTDYLYRSMVRAGIHVFLDSKELDDGKEINEILEVVNKSRIYIPIFSKDFASSIWCLREVERMVECRSKSNGKKEIIPIFYDVMSDDVKLRTDLYKKAILKHKKYPPNKVQQWMSALKTVGKIKGRELLGKRQGGEIDSIVEQVSRKLNTRRMSVSEHFVEDNAQVEAIMKLLDVGSNGVRFVGIHGMGGIGKTTLATILYNRLSFHFEGCSFLGHVQDHWQRLDGCLELQKKLLSDFVNTSIIEQIKDVHGGREAIKRVLRNKKVLIVLDDLDKPEQLQMLAGKSNWFGSGSRIIITTRNKSIMKTQGESSSKEVPCQTEEIVDYEVQEMKSNQALQLFYKHALRSDSPTEDYNALSRDIVSKVARLPLAIEVIGSYFYGLSFASDSNETKKELLREMLQKLTDGPFKDVYTALKISYDGLGDNEKEVFLDIACFFTNEDQTYPIRMWDDCKYRPISAIRVLQLWSLIKIRDNKFWMHDQVRDLGRYIVKKECPFSRVWIDEDDLLKRKEENERIEALSLTSGGHNRNFTDEELAALPKLRFLRAKGSDFCGDFKNILSKLRWLSWQIWQTSFQGKNFHFSRLVVLSLSNSNIEDGWDGWSEMKMNKLKVLDLTGCMCLKRTPDFSNFTSLEMLILAQCVKLTTIDGSIGKLNNLKTFNINGCKVLEELPVEFGSLQSLTEIIMPQNYQNFKLPNTFGNLQSLSSFILDEHPEIRELPNSIGRLEKITRLSLCGCVGIKELPYSIGGMKELAELDLSKSGIVELPDSIRSLDNLKVIKVSYTLIEKFPHTIGQVKMLEELHAKKCWNLRDENIEEIGKLTRLRILDISYTGVSRFPIVLDCLTSLQTLEMSSSDLQEVPDLPSSLKCLHMQAPHFPSIPDLSSLVKLDYLELSILSHSIEEPDIARTDESPAEQLIHLLPSSLSTLKFRGINLLPPYSNLSNLLEISIIEYSMSRFSISQDLEHLRELKLSKCNLLEEICGLSLLTNLKCLDLNRLESLVEIRGLKELKSLEHLRIAHCSKMERLPNLSKLDKLRHIELEACPNIREIEGIKGTKNLKLDDRGCTILKRLSDDRGSTWLPHKIPMYDVFLSFRGLDTRHSIVEIVYGNLVRNKILVFRDDEELSSGIGIGEELLLALDDSHMFIPFLSKNYASSIWCLRELAHMVKCGKSVGKRILPIFYDVEVDDVKLESTLYRSALDDHRRWIPEKEVEEWEEALRYVGRINGYNLKTQSLGEVIELVTEDVSTGLLSYADARRPRAVED